MIGDRRKLDVAIGFAGGCLATILAAMAARAFQGVTPEWGDWKEMAAAIIGGAMTILAGWLALRSAEKLANEQRTERLATEAKAQISTMRSALHQILAIIDHCDWMRRITDASNTGTPEDWREFPRRLHLATKGYDDLIDFIRRRPIDDPMIVGKIEGLQTLIELVKVKASYFHATANSHTREEREKHRRIADDCVTSCIDDGIAILEAMKRYHGSIAVAAAYGQAGADVEVTEAYDETIVPRRVRRRSPLRRLPIDLQFDGSGIQPDN